MCSPLPNKRRIDADVAKLIGDNHEVNILGEGLQEFTVKFHGPAETPYAGGIWIVKVDIPDRYPFSSPSIGFVNRIFHPNVDEASGTICLDVINQKWSALFDLANIFESFLPQLLRYPNPEDPLNSIAAQMYMHNKDAFLKKVQDYIQLYATEEALTTLRSITASKDASSSESSSPFSSDNEADDGV